LEGLYPNKATVAVFKSSLSR